MRAWLLRFFGGPVDGAAIEAPETRELAYVFPCPNGCKAPHGEVQAHLTFDRSVAPDNAEVYRRERIDEEKLEAFYVLADTDLSPLIEEEEEVLVGA